MSKYLLSEEKKKNALIFLLSILATFIPVIIIETKVLFYSSGFFIYPLDDTFIHMQLARNLALHHTWGINIGQFSAASSSLLYTVLLAVLFFLFGVHTVIPFVINCVAVIVLLAVLQQWLIRQAVQFKGQLVILGLVIFLTPFATLIMSGMEHTLQCLFSFLFITHFSDWLIKADNKIQWPVLPWNILLYGLLNVAIRYEGLFVIASAALILLLRRDIRNSLILVIISLIPLILFGVYSITHGGFFLPNSVLIKSDNLPGSLFGAIKFLSNILIEKLTFSRAGIAPLAMQRILILLPLCYFAFRNNLKTNASYTIILMMVFGYTLLHMTLAATGWFYRYEAYLVMLGVLIISFFVIKFCRADQLFPLRLSQAFVFVLVFFLGFPIILRSATAFSKSVASCINIYDQQYQMARFCKSNYDSKVIAANDIGALSFYTNDTILDLWGLADNQVARSRKGNYWTAGFLDSQVQNNHASIAIVYDKWFSDSLLKRWNKVASWQIINNVVCGDSIVSFYAMDSIKQIKLKQNLVNFQNKLPPTVKVIYSKF
ncbi:MAG: hypothetical protein NVSMB67_05310 [Flavisolibacter sp.]